MPTVPRYVQTERPQGYQNVQPVAGGAEAMGRAMRGLGDALGGVGRDMWGIAIAERDKFDKAILQEKQTAYEDIMLTAQQRESERKGKNALGDDQGNQGVFDSISRIHKETAEQCMQGLNQRQKAMLGDYFDKRGRSFSEWGHSYEQREKGVYEQGQAQAYQQSQILRALNNPAELQAAMGNYAQSVLEFNRSRGIDDEATRLQIQQGWDKFGMSLVRQYLDGDNLGAATAFLKAHGKDLSQYVVRGLQNNLRSAREAAYHKAIAMENRRLAMAERAEKQAAKAVEKNLVDHLMKGDLRLEDVQAARDLLSPDDYRQWSERAITGPKQATTNDKKVYLDLLDKKDRSEDITSDARSAFLDGKITEKTYMELTREASEEENKIFYGYIANALKPSEFNKNPASGENYANARRDFELYLKNHPTASYEEKDAESRSIAKRYSLINTDNTTLALPMPKFFEGSRADIRRQTLDAAAIKTVEAYKAGRITEQEFLEESQRIQALTRAVERLEAGTPATTKPRGKR